MQDAAHGAGGSGAGSLSTGRCILSNTVIRSSSVSSAPGEAAIIPEGKVNGYWGKQYQEY